MKKHLTAFIKYKHYKSLSNDLKLLRSTKFFNAHYYTTYNPNLSRLRINPYLHYLLFGGFDGRDPGPEFDSSWYIKTYPEVRQAGHNPLIHYLNIGKESNYQSYSPKPGKHIEFLGLNGSGKTTLYFKGNAYLSDHLGYYPGPSNVWTGMTSDVRLKAIGQFPINFINFFIDNQNFISDVLRANKQVYGSDYHLPSIPKLKNQYFLILCAYYHAVKKDHAKPWCMFDEGFCSILKRYVVNYDNKVDQSLSDRVLQQMPKPDLLIYINSDVNLCIERMSIRKSGIPGPYRQLSEGELRELLTRAANNNQRYFEIIQNTGIKIVKVDNNGPIEEAASNVNKAISELLEEQN